jgi:lipopolysaccharide export system protein LptC
MRNRWKIVLILSMLAIGSAWLLNRLADDKSTTTVLLRHDPDYYMEDFSTLTMEQDGTPKNKLLAEYMAHYPNDNTIELLKPKLEIYRKNETPIFVTADKGWVTANNEVILLRGAVKLWQDSIDGNRELEINTSEVKILSQQEYAETDKLATIVGKRTTASAIGVRAYFKESRIELLNDVHGKILPKKQAN